MRRLLPLLTVLGAVACSSNVSTMDATAPVDGSLTYFTDRTVHGPGARELAQVPLPGLRGADGPAAAGTADGRVIYATYTERVEVDPMRTEAEQGIEPGTVLGRMSVRLAGPAGDHELVAGGFAPAVAQDGRIAVGLLDDPDDRFGADRSAAIAVLAPGSTEPRRWTASDGLLTPVAWAGTALLYAVPSGSGQLAAVRVTTGPGSDRPFADSGVVVTVSPTGDRVLLAVPVPGGGERLSLQLRDLSGATLSTLDSGLRWVGAGRWTPAGITVVGAPAPGKLAALELDPLDGLRQRARHDLDYPADLATPPSEIAITTDGTSFGAATFVAGTRAPNTAWVVLGCSLTAHRCTRGDLPAGVHNTGFVGALP